MKKRTKNSEVYVDSLQQFCGRDGAWNMDRELDHFRLYTFIKVGESIELNDGWYTGNSNLKIVSTTGLEVFSSRLLQTWELQPASCAAIVLVV